MEIMLAIFAVLFLSYWFGKLSRMKGGGAPSLPWGLDSHLVALPFGIAGGILGQCAISIAIVTPWFTIPSVVVAAFISYSSAFLGKRLGHGQYFDLATFIGKIIKPEKIDFIVKLFFGTDPLTKDPEGKTPFWRDFFGLSLTGVVLPLGLACLACVAGHIFWMVALLLSGAAKALAYELPKDHPDHVRGFMEKYLFVKFDKDTGFTEPGEWIFGWVTGLAVFSYLAFIVLTFIL